MEGQDCPEASPADSEDAINRRRKKHRTGSEQPEANSFRSSMSVCIIGGGLSGLSCALALQHIGVTCTVYERDR